MVDVALSDESKHNLCMCGCTQCCCPSILIEDHFAGTNGDSIMNRLPDTHDINTLWGPFGSASIDSNQLAFPANTNNAIPVISGAVPGTAGHPVTVTADLILGDASDNVAVGIIGREANGNLWMGVIIAKNVPADPLPRCELIQISDNGLTYTVRDMSYHAFAVNTTYAATMVFDGNDISFTADGVTLSYSSTDYNTQTDYGLYSTSSNTTSNINRADNFKVECA